MIYYFLLSFKLDIDSRFVFLLCIFDIFKENFDTQTVEMKKKIHMHIFSYVNYNINIWNINQNFCLRFSKVLKFKYALITLYYKKKIITLHKVQNDTSWFSDIYLKWNSSNLLN